MVKDKAEIKETKRMSGGIRAIVIILILTAAAELFNVVFNSGYPSFLIQKDAAGTVCFNKAALGKLYENYKDVPYNFCQDFSSKKSKGTYRVFLLGEASLSGWPYSTEQSISRKVKNNLQKYAPEITAEIITVSFAGFNSHLAADIIPNLFKYHPDMIILYSGHNEFYGYQGRSTADYFSRLITVNVVQSVFGGMQNRVQVNYDNETDDLELMLPLLAQEKFISSEKQIYNSIIKNYKANLISIARACKENSVHLVISELADNYQVPPVGITNIPGQLSADIIFNNARMALLRDGNQVSAEKLFYRSLQLDGFRLRIPGEFAESIKTISELKNITTAQIKKEFCRFSQNNIPGNDLFLDYIHPNMIGLDIIAAEYSRIIMKEAGSDKNYSGFMEFKKEDSLKTNYAGDDLRIEKLRIEKSSSLLKNAKLSGKIAPASF